MFYFLLGLLILDALLLSVVVLLQAGKGGGLAAMGGGGAGSDTLLGGRQAATLLTKSTWWLGGAFLVLSLALSTISAPGGRTGTILRDEFEAAPATQPLPDAGQSAPAVPGAEPGAPE